MPAGLGPRAARVYDQLWVRFRSQLRALPPATLNQISPANPLRRLLKTAGYALVRLVGHLFRPVRNPESLHGTIWLYVVSQNNVEALHFLREARPDARFVAGQGKNIGRYGTTANRLSLRRKILYYWQLPFVYWQLARAEGWAVWRFFDLVFVAIGYAEVYRRALRHYQPRAVVFANDHNDDARAMLLACRQLGIPTIYLQHASVSSLFPPLAFDLSLLEGRHDQRSGAARGYAQSRRIRCPAEHRLPGPTRCYRG